MAAKTYLQCFLIQLLKLFIGYLIFFTAELTAHFNFFSGVYQFI